MNRGSLSVGDVVSAGLRIYRDHFQSYFKIALIASLWSIVPVYGWAKYGTATGSISRLAFFEVIEKPETETQARNRVNLRMWNFLVAGIIVILILSGSLLGFFLVAGIVGGVIAGVVGSDALGVLIIVIGFLFWLIFYFWLFSRLSLVEICLGIEENSDATRAIGRSWTLTQRFVGRLQLIYFVGFLIFIPIFLIANLLSGIAFAILNPILGQDLASLLSNLFVNILFTAIMMPFWQSIKAVIYYDLRSRREGIDLGI